MELQGLSLIGWADYKFKEQPAKLFLHEKPSVSLVTTSVTLVTEKQTSIYLFWLSKEQHFSAFNAGFKKSTMTSWRILIPHLGDDLACFNFRQLWRYLHAVDLNGLCFGRDYHPYCMQVYSFWLECSSMVHVDSEHSKCWGLLEILSKATLRSPGLFF